VRTQIPRPNLGRKKQGLRAGVHGYERGRGSQAARAAGIRLGIDGDDLVLEASAPPPPAMIDLLSRHKAGIVALLRPAEDGWSAEDWQVFFDERAGRALSRMRRS
jgi:hypothetical protein